MFYDLAGKLALAALTRDLGNLYESERSLARNEQFVRAAANSPEKGWPDPRRTSKHVRLPFRPNEIGTFAPIVVSVTRTCRRGLSSLSENPKSPKVKVEDGFLSEFEELARRLGIGAIGYARVPPELIFRDRAILSDHAIVLAMEMDKNKIDRAPSKETQVMVFQTYDRLGKVVNQLTDFLRGHGYAAQAGYPLGGLVLYPALAHRAGLGWHGRHGLLITPQFGPRQRIGAIFTTIDNLPESDSNPHSWIPEYCRRCGRCIRECPAQAIRETPVLNDNGTKTHIVRDRCFPMFYDNHVCAVCVKVCAFNTLGYAAVKERFLKTLP